jgi:hypothetical protein
MRNYTYFFIMLGALAIGSAVLAGMARLPEKRHPTSQEAQTIRHTERESQGVYEENLPQQHERRVGEPLREEDRQRNEGYHGMRRDRWHYADEDWPDDDYYYTRRGYWHDDRGRLGDSRVFPWNW